MIGEPLLVAVGSTSNLYFNIFYTMKGEVANILVFDNFSNLIYNKLQEEREKQNEL